MFSSFAVFSGFADLADFDDLADFTGGTDFAVVNLWNTALNQANIALIRITKIAAQYRSS
jgi:hypothetical protein